MTRSGGLCDHYLIVQDLDDDDAEADYGDEEDYGDEDDESPWEHLAYLAAGIEAGIAEVPRAWKLDRRYASTLTGEPLPVPPSPDLRT